MLRSIEAQHGLLVERARGIYSFSHLTFQEYFTAREIVYSSNQEKALKNLVSHITEKPWQEVFLLAVGMLKNADNLLQLMKQQVDAFLVVDEKLQWFLTWVNQKSRSVETPYKPAAVRAFYFNLEFSLARVRDLGLDLTLTGLDLTLTGLDLALARDLALDRARDRDLSINRNLALNRVFALDRALVNNRAQARDRVRNLALDHDFALTFALAFALTLGLAHNRDDQDFPLGIDYDLANDLERTLTRTLARDFDLAKTFNHKLDLELQFKLQQLKEQLPDTSNDNRKNFLHWLQVDSQAWIEQLRPIMIEHRNIGHEWQFTDSQKELLKQYYDANKLLVDCLNSDCYVSREVRQEIEDTLLLPVKQ